MSRPIWTANGYNLFDVISALQKAIRRAEEEEAMYWALELVPRAKLLLGDPDGFVAERERERRLADASDPEAVARP